MESLMAEVGLRVTSGFPRGWGESLLLEAALDLIVSIMPKRQAPRIEEDRGGSFGSAGFGEAA